MRRSAARPRGRGFGLAELLLACALWSAAFLGVMALYTTCYAAVMHSNNIANATNLAQSKLEAVKFVSYSNINSMPEATTTYSSVVNGVSLTSTFYYTMTVTPNGSNTMKTVVVDVSWEESQFNGSNRSNWKSLSLETKITQ